MAKQQGGSSGGSGNSSSGTGNSPKPVVIRENMGAGSTKGTARPPKSTPKK